MNVPYRELKRWANNFGIKTRGLPRYEIEDLVNEAISYRMDIGRADSLNDRQRRWYRWWNSEMADDDPQVDVPREMPMDRRVPVPFTQPPVEVEEVPKCSFCDKDQDEVDWLIFGPNAHICNECILLSVDMIKDAKAKGKPEKESPSIYCGNLYRRKLRVKK